MRFFVFCWLLAFILGLVRCAALVEQEDQDELLPYPSFLAYSLGRNASRLRITSQIIYDAKQAKTTKDPEGSSPDTLPKSTACTGRSLHKKRAPTPVNAAPTPAPTGESSSTTTVHITDIHDFALLLPSRSGELISDAESDGVAFCAPESTDSTCTQRFQDGFIRAASVTRSSDGAWIQVTGCLDTSKSNLDPSDDGGQFDVRFPNGAQCAFGGYGASFIEQVEPSAGRFCLRCCAAENDQTHCNSHQDTAGCLVAVPGEYDFPEHGVNCS
ncbi:hypothetical protein OBBRIDRAFT_770542 [Obba rivulosa]|uniref:Uncharacterized protein n=1 Tax=Obba rivulosa TaxID=1052685 RepID=A0A8E2DQU8_9APHY|nr:hypothetical protein OBBRIDRAFT_770542 [Obba rivulosa]